MSLNGQGQKQELEEASKHAIEVRQRLNYFFQFMVARIEHTADSIALVSDDHSIDEFAIHWKLYSIGAAQQSAFMRNPIASSIDMSIFLAQMTNYFENGIGKDRFGEFSKFALSCSKKLQGEMNIQVMSIIAESIDMASKNQILLLYVKEHPIKDHYFTRESTVPFFEELLLSDKVKLKKLADNMSESIYDMSDRLNIYSVLLPKMMAWEMELMMMRMYYQHEINVEYDKIMANYDDLTRAMVDGPSWTDSLILMTFHEVGKERNILLLEMERQRLEMQAYASEERQILLDALANERSIIIDEARALTSESMNTGSSHVQNLADDWFDKALILMGIFIAGLLGYGLIRRHGSR